MKRDFFMKFVAAICLVCTLFCCMGSKVYADTDVGENERLWGGVLLNPVISLLTSIGDFIMEILHDSVQEQSISFIKVEIEQETWWNKVGKSIFITVVAILIAVVVIAVAMAVPGAIAAAAAAFAHQAVGVAFFTAALNAAGSAVVAGVVAGSVAGYAFVQGSIPRRYIFTSIFYIARTDI